MRVLFIGLLILTALLGSNQSQAQQPSVVPDSSIRPAAKPAAGAAPDIILLLNGDELPAQVLRITPETVRYLAPLVTTTLPAAADTLQLAAADIFMIRYANGTREVLRPIPVASGTSLLGLSAAQRSERGRQDSRQYYKPDKGVFWGTFAGTATTGYGGLVVGTVVSLTDPPRAKLNAPEPDLLNDPAYYSGYRRQAQSRKLGKAAAGFGTGLGVGLMVVLMLLSNVKHF